MAPPACLHDMCSHCTGVPAHGFTLAVSSSLASHSFHHCLLILMYAVYPSHSPRPPRWPDPTPPCQPIQPDGPSQLCGPRGGHSRCHAVVMCSWNHSSHPITIVFTRHSIFASKSLTREANHEARV